MNLAYDFGPTAGDSIKQNKRKIIRKRQQEFTKPTSRVE